jgi:hypothetical protein
VVVVAAAATVVSVLLILRFFFFIRAQSISPRCTAAYRLIVRPLSPRDF